MTVSLMGLQPNKEPQLERDTDLAFENLVLKRVTQLHLRRNTVLHPENIHTPRYIAAPGATSRRCQGKDFPDLGCARAGKQPL